MRRYVLTVICPDRVGIVAAVTGLLARLGGSVLEAAQHGDLATGKFFLRIEIAADSLPERDRPRRAAGGVRAHGSRVRHGVEAERHRRAASAPCCSPARRTIAWPTCSTAGEQANSSATSRASIANHEDLRDLVEWHGIPFRWVPVGTEPADKEAAFAEMERIVDEERTDVVILARYMQIIPPSMCAAPSGRHHQHPPLVPALLRRSSPVPAGVRPRRQADRRHLSLRDGGSGRGPDHRAGHPAHRPRRLADGAAPGRARHRADGIGPGRALAPRGPGAPQREQDRRLHLSARACARWVGALSPWRRAGSRR